MVWVLDEKREALTHACSRFGVRRLDAFGPASEGGVATGGEEIDLLVEFAPMSPHEIVDAYFALLDELRAILGEHIQLVMPDAVKNPYAAAEIERTRRAVYGA